MNDETEKRIEAARAVAERESQTQEFLASLTKNDTLVKPVYNPEAYVMREKFRGQANRGELQRTDCRHPLAYIQQYIDDDPLVQRAGRPVNLFVCGVCEMPIWFCDPWGDPLGDS